MPNRNIIKIAKEYIDACIGLMDLPWLRRFKKIGTDPVASIMAKSTINVLTISRKSKLNISICRFCEVSSVNFLDAQVAAFNFKSV